MSDYEIFAIRYGAIEERKRAQNFIVPVPGDHDVGQALNFYLWVIRSDRGTWVVDTGFSEATAAKRGRVISRPVREGLRALGVDPASVRDVVLTHLHYDHAGNHDLFPQAKFHVQDREMHYCTSRCMCDHFARHHYEADDVKHIIDRIFREQVAFHDGSAEIADGLSVHLVGGHTRGLQVVRVRTKRGWVVLASDAAHYYDNYRLQSPFPAVVDVADMLQGYRILRGLADSDDHIIPGHDPMVEQIYPKHNGIDGIYRLDVAPQHV